MRVLVTGAGGFVGAHVAARLAARGHDVIATSRSGAPAGAPARMPTAIVWRGADLAADELAPLVAGCNAIVHCAARASPWGEYAAFHCDNVLATERLVAAARRAGRVRRFVHLSTPSIYFRYADQEDIAEPFEPPRTWPTFYARTKWEAECHALAASELEPIALRPRAVFGTGDRAIVPRLLAVARRGWFPLPRGGTARVDVTHVDNVVDAVELALAAPAQLAGRAYNVTNGEPITVRALLDRLFAASSLRVRYVPVPRALGLALANGVEAIASRLPGRPEPRITSYGFGLIAFTQTLSIAAARRDLGYVPRIGLDEGLARLAGGS